MSNINYSGIVTVKQGNDIVFENAKNHFTTYGMQTIPCFLNLNYILQNGGTYTNYTGLCSNNWSMYIGTNTSVATTPGMTALNAPIGTTPGTAPSAKSSVVIDGTSTGIWATIWTGVWYPGTVIGTIGEMALYLCYCNTTTANGWNFTSGSNASVNVTAGMFSRLSVADGDFQAFAIDTTKALSIDWNIQLSYA